LRGNWWTTFGDTRLNTLIEQGLSGSPTLAALAARVQQARAQAGLAEAARSPQVSLGADATRGTASDGTGRIANNLRAQGLLNYELDAFGRLRNESRAAALDAQAQGIGFEAARTALAADIAQNWFALQGLDEERMLLAATIALREDNLRLTERRAALGDTTELDTSRARTELATTRAELLAVQRARNLTENALSLLIGQPAAEFSAGAASLPAALPDVPVALPSALLERRPDVAAAQRRLEAANARIGAANAAFFPRVNLTAAGGFASPEISDLFKWSSRAWLLGPLLSLPVFDGGARRANLASAQAGYEAAVGEYRQQVLVAFKDVEDSLVSLSALAGQARETDQALAAAQRAAQLSETRYRNGLVSYFEVIDSQRTALAVQRNAVQLKAERAQAVVGLMRALGGGWQAQAAVAPT
jgi:multidrug efflux system outer membrane protein